MQTNNSELLREIQSAVKGSMLEVPRTTSNMIVPTVEVNPRLVKPAFVKNITTSSGAATIYTTPTMQDFYLCSASLSICKDVSCDTSAVNLRTTINGATVEFLSIAGITLTVSNQSLSVSFPHPIKIDRGVVIQMNHTKTAGVFFGTAQITGFLDETSNA